MRLMIAVPTHDHVPALFSYDLAQMMCYIGANYVGPDQPIKAVSLTYVTGTLIHTARNDLARMALDAEADFILWLDSDMRFPKDLPIRLMKHRKDIVGINYSSRGVPPRFVAIKTIKPKERLVTGPESTGLEEVDALGFGAVLIRVSAVRKMVEDHPDKNLFWFGVNEEGGMVGEDVWFCTMAKSSGFEVFVDHDLSKECAHVGTLEYLLDHAQVMADEEE